MAHTCSESCDQHSESNRDLTNTTMWFQQNGMVANPDKYQALVLGNTTPDFDIKNKEEPIPDPYLFPARYSYWA